MCYIYHKHIAKNISKARFQAFKVTQTIGAYEKTLVDGKIHQLSSFSIFAPFPQFQNLTPTRSGTRD